MNKHVFVDDLPIVKDVDAELRQELNALVNSGYVWEAVSNAGIRSSYDGYRYVIDAVEILLTEENPRDEKLLQDILCGAFAVDSHVIKRAMKRALHAASYQDCCAYIFDGEDRARVTEKAFYSSSVVMMLAYLVSHCVDYAQAEIAERHAN